MSTPEPELFERNSDVAELAEALVRAGGGHGAMVAIEGPAGIGKTRLLGELLQRASDADMQVLAARGGELERDFAFGVVRQLFEPFLARHTPAERDELFAGAAALARPLFFEGAAVAPGGQEAFALLHGLFWLAVNIAAARTLVLAIDDLHWCDGESLRWLDYLARRLDGLPLLVALAARPGECADASRLVASAKVVRPLPLTPAATAELVGAGADAAFCAACHTASGGNPLLLRELTRALATEGVAPTAANAARVTEIGGDAVSVAVRLRLDALPAGAARLAEAAAVLGDGSELYTAAALAGLTEEEADAAGVDLARADVLHGEPEFAFTHPLVRAAVLASLPLGARERAHARAARLLSEAGAPDEQVAAHVAAAPTRGDARAVDALRTAARSALARGGAEAAVSYLRRALEEPPGPNELADVLFELGVAEQRLHGPSSVEHLRFAVELGEGRPWHGDAALALGRTLTFAGDVAEAAAVFAHAIAQRPQHGADEVRGRLEAGLLLIAVTESRFRRLGEPLLELLRHAGPPPGPAGRMMVAALAYHDARAGGSREQAVERSRAALEGGTVIEESDAATFVLPGLVLAAADQLDEARSVWDDAFAHARASGSVFAFATASCFRTDVLHVAGSLPEAEADGRAALDAARAHGIEAGIPWVVAFLTDVLLARGDVAEAERVVEESGLGADPPDTTHFHRYLLARGRLLAALGRHEEAVACLTKCGRRFEAVGGLNPAFVPWRSVAAGSLLQLGRRQEALDRALEELALARDWGAPRALASALVPLGLAQGGEDGLATLLEAADLLRESPALVDRARALLELGAALRRSNSRAAARGSLREALQLAHDCGAAPLEERARQELLASGARPRRAAIYGRDSLTPSERRVAVLAAEGHTNRAIAQSLFVAPKTVEVHLRNVFRKLDLSSRAELPDALQRPAAAV